MKTENIILIETITARLTTIERVKFSQYVEKTDTTKSEMIRTLIVNFLHKQRNQLLTNKL